LSVATIEALRVEPCRTVIFAASLRFLADQRTLTSAAAVVKRAATACLTSPRSRW
jgi:hypothetical protein